MHLVIIGNGIAGITTARHVRKLSDHRITVISSESEHFYSRPALMYIYMGHMRFRDTKPYEDWFWEKNRIDLVHDHVTAVDTAKRSLSLRSGKTMDFDKLVIATGSSSNSFDWPGQDLPGVQGLYGLGDLERMEENTAGINKAIVVGGGLIGVEMAEMLHSRGIHVTMLVREAGYWGNVLPKEEADLVARHIREHGVDLRLSTELEAIHAGDDGRAASVTTKNGDRIDGRFVGLAVGVHPNIDFLDGSGIGTDRGVLVNRNMETDVGGIYAAGDCAQFREPPEGRRPVEPVWYTGKMQGVTLAHNICGRELAYAPGPWFNSAKFFDIEFQTYGSVPSDPNDGLDSIYWEQGRCAVRLVYERDDLRFIGANLLGVRGRHHLFHELLEHDASIREVIEALPAAEFDPEFFPEYAERVAAIYNERFPGNPVTLKQSRGLRAFWNKLTSRSA